MTARIVFLCARGSSRSIVAASLLAAHAGERWEVWGTPTLDGHVEAYRSLRDTLMRVIRMKLLLPTLLTIVPSRK